RQHPVPQGMVEQLAPPWAGAHEAVEPLGHRGLIRCRTQQLEQLPLRTRPVPAARRAVGHGASTSLATRARSAVRNASPVLNVASDRTLSGNSTPNESSMSSTRLTARSESRP